jgi:hypothetical protein
MSRFNYKNHHVSKCMIARHALLALIFLTADKPRLKPEICTVLELSSIQLDLTGIFSFKERLLLNVLEIIFRPLIIFLT